MATPTTISMASIGLLETKAAIASRVLTTRGTDNHRPAANNRHSDATDDYSNIDHAPMIQEERSEQPLRRPGSKSIVGPLVQMQMAFPIAMTSRIAISKH